MTINEYQKLAMTTLNPELSQKDILINGVMGLCGESGEAIDIVKKWLAQGHELDKEKLAKELGDVAWYLAETATALGLNLEDIFAPIRQNLGIIRHKGHFFIGVKGAVTAQGGTVAVNATGRLDLGINGNSIPNAGVVAATGTDSTQVHILHQKIIAGDQILVFCDQFAVLGDQAVTGHHQILGGLCRAGGAERIHTAANGRLIGHQILPISPLADRFVGSRQVDDHFCAI